MVNYIVHLTSLATILLITCSHFRNSEGQLLDGCRPHTSFGKEAIVSPPSDRPLDNVYIDCPRALTKVVFEIRYLNSSLCVCGKINFRESLQSFFCESKLAMNVTVKASSDTTAHNISCKFIMRYRRSFVVENVYLDLILSPGGLVLGNSTVVSSRETHSLVKSSTLAKITSDGVVSVFEVSSSDAVAPATSRDLSIAQVAQSRFLSLTVVTTSEIHSTIIDVTLLGYPSSDVVAKTPLSSPLSTVAPSFYTTSNSPRVFSTHHPLLITCSSLDPPVSKGTSVIQASPTTISLSLSSTMSAADQDVNECDNSSICPQGYTCVNTIGSYSCVCKTEGYAKDKNNACIKVKKYQVQIRLKENYHPQFNNQTSQEFKSIEKRIMNAVEAVYRNNDNYVQTTIVSLKNGSVFADLKMTFKSSDVTAMNELLTAVRKNSFGDIKVDKDSVTILNSGSCKSNPSLCPNNSNCEIITNTTYTCPCKNGFSSNGTQCEANIVVAVEIVVQRKFTEDLKNESSTEYVELKKDVTNELTELFKNTPNFEKVIVTGFSNGSLKIKFKVIYRKPPAKEPKINKKVLVAKTLRKKAETGFIGKLKVTADAIQIQQSPPPPKNVSADQVTEDQILIIWKEPDESEYFGIHKYIVSYKTLSETKFQTKDVVSQRLNRQLSDLKSDTYYVITVHGVNDEGHGEKSNTIHVRTLQEETDNNKVVIIVVVVIVVILLIVAVLVGLYCLREKKRRSMRQEPKFADPVKLGQLSKKSNAYGNPSYDNDEQRTTENI